MRFAVNIDHAVRPAGRVAGGKGIGRGLIHFIELFLFLFFLVFLHVSPSLMQTFGERRGFRREQDEGGGRLLSVRLNAEEAKMRSVILWLIGIPIPIILLIALFTHHF